MESENKMFRRKITALKIHQWLPQWNRVQFDAKEHRRKPKPCFYMFKLSAAELKALTGIHRRKVEGAVPRSEDLGIQRRHDKRRSDEIGTYIHHGYPWSDLSKTRQQSGKYNDLLNPGWLPTAIIVNIRESGFERRGRKLAEVDSLKVTEDSESVTIELPEGFIDSTWRPSELHPLEVIDGQHRLWAFEEQDKDGQLPLWSLEESLGGKFELPVIAFHNLDVSWQAYLFWTINISPKRINRSLAFDLYPLLRTESWLQRFDARVYRETRAQELTEALWSYPNSPWYQRINMLGERGQKMVSQAAWIRALRASYIKSWEGPGVKIGGLFGAPVGENEEILPWSRAQQAAFLIFIWQKIIKAIQDTDAEWAQSLRGSEGKQATFFGDHTLLNTDQGIRGVLYVTNDLLYVCADELGLDSWDTEIEPEASATDEVAINGALDSLYSEQTIVEYIEAIAIRLSTYDWRTSTAPGLGEEDRVSKLVFRGSGGYKELRRQLLKHIERQGDTIGKTANEVLRILGYE